jgi:hypothetical protein
MKISHHKSANRALAVALALVISGLLSIAASQGVTSSTARATVEAAQPAQISALDFRNAMRLLWEDHISWTRLYIVSALADLPDKGPVAERLLRNQDDIGNAIKPFYGEAAGNSLAQLLKEHILGADALLSAAKAGDNAAIETARAGWYANADEIAAFLAGANPAWPRDQIASTMKMHLDLTLEEALARLKGDWAADAVAYDKIHQHILAMADVLSDGIMAQFPDRFSAAPPAGELSLRTSMRQAWEDHILWTRLLIVSAISDLPDKEVALTRLLQNQVDIGNAIKPYYGDAAGEQLASLLRDHITGAVDVLTAAANKDNAAVDAAAGKWYANGDDIATFLSGANPQAWPLDALKSMMKGHLDLTLAEAVAHLGGDYAKDIADYDRVHEHILGMADALSEGIISQFPERFGASSVTTGPMPSEHVGMPMTGGTADGAPYFAWTLTFTGMVLLGLGLVVLKRAYRRR